MTPEAIKADHLISTEIAKQNRMWGEHNERADSTKGQLFHAALAQLDLLDLKQQFSLSSEEAINTVIDLGTYPRDWSGFRDYGSDIANLVVAAAYIRQEIVRKLRNGESDYRAPRTQPYDEATGLPAVSE